MSQRKVKKRSGFFLHLLKLFFFLIIIAALSGTAIYFLCETKHVSIKGNSVARKKEIREAILTDPHDKNAVYAVIRNVFSKQVEIPFVKSYKVSMKDPNTLQIRVREKKLRGYVINDRGNRYVYYGPNGKVQESSERFVKGVFFVDGLTVRKAVNGQPLDVGRSNIKTMLLLQEEIEKEELPVKTVHFSEDGMITFQVRYILVNLGTRAYLAEKMRRLPYILPKLKKRKGTLHLEDWSEDNTDIVFEYTE